MSKQGWGGGEGGCAEGRGGGGGEKGCSNSCTGSALCTDFFSVQNAQAEIMIHMVAGLRTQTIPVTMALTWKKTMSSCQSLGSKGHMDPRQAEEQ